MASVQVSPTWGCEITIGPFVYSQFYPAQFPMGAWIRGGRGKSPILLVGSGKKLEKRSSIIHVE